MMSNQPNTTAQASSNDQPHSRMDELRAQLDGAVQHLFSTVKVIARNDDLNRCPSHPERYVCSCPVAMEMISADSIDHVKREHFLRPLCAQFLKEEYRFDFDGSQESHHAFKQQHGDTAKHFVRTFLQREIFKEEFGQVGKQAVTIDAMLKGLRGFVIRTKDLEQNLQGNENRGFAMIRDFAIGSPEHKTVLWVLPLSCKETPEKQVKWPYRTSARQKVYLVDARIVRVDACHEGCGKVRENALNDWPAIAATLARDFYKVKFSLVVVTLPLRVAFTIFHESGEHVDNPELCRCLRSAGGLLSHVPDVDESLKEW